jgi:uncharacterized Ntn-hydrolase superfamily protein
MFPTRLIGPLLLGAPCPKSGAFGIAVTSSSVSVASRCAWVGPLGAVATQNVTDPALGTSGLALLRQRPGAGAVLRLLLAGTPEPEWRQIAVNIGSKPLGIGRFSPDSDTVLV